jgi:hypothetical protein
MKTQDALSIHRSFIVRLYPEVNLDSGEISGQVEHIVSGEAKEFCSVEELLRSIDHLLDLEDIGPAPYGEE